MADPIDDMLQGDDQPESPANEGQQDVQSTSEEEVEFNKLKGSSQQRVRELWLRAKKAEEEASSLRSQQQQPSVPPAPDPNFQQQQALDILSKAGVATDDKVKKEVNSAVEQIRRDLRNANLTQKYDGENSPVAFNPDEVADYQRTHPQYASYDPEDVFLYKMYPDEFANAQISRNSGTRIQGIKPTKQHQRQEALTPEFIEQRLQQPDGDEWYEKNQEEINKVVYNHTMQFKGQNFNT